MKSGSTDEVIIPIALQGIPQDIFRSELVLGFGSAEGRAYHAPEHLQRGHQRKDGASDIRWCEEENAVQPDHK
jgi:hypothetical protein